MLTGPRSKEIIPAVAAHSSNVKRRLLGVLNPELNRRPISVFSTVFTVAAFVVLTLTLSAAQPRAKALDAAADAGVNIKITGQEDSSTDKDKKDGELFSAKYYKGLKAKRPGKSKKLVKKSHKGDHDVNLEVTNSWGMTTGHKYTNCEHEIKGEIKCEDGAITLYKIDLYDPEDDFYMEARNVILDPDSEHGFEVLPGDREGGITMVKPIDGSEMRRLGHPTSGA
jgi:hypothetical protein